MCFSTIEEAHREYEYGQIPIYRDSPFQREKIGRTEVFRRRNKDDEYRFSGEDVFAFEI